MRVLDLACGFGRISHGLAARGAAVIGVDSSRDLLGIAREHGGPGTDVRFILGDMREVHGNAEFDVVLVWSTSLGYYEERDDEATLAAACQALVPGGRLLVESRHWDAFNRQFQDYTERRHDDDMLREWHSYDPVTGRQNTLQRLRLGGHQSERSYHVRRYGIPELRAMAIRLGLTEVSAFDENAIPLTTTSERAILRAHRPAG